MSFLVEPWQNIGIYDCQLSKIEKLKKIIIIINPNTMASLKNLVKKVMAGKRIFLVFCVNSKNGKKMGKKTPKSQNHNFFNKKCMRFLVKGGGGTLLLTICHFSYF